MRGLLPGLLILLLAAAPVRAATYTVTKTADTADGACDADCSLREAIVAANADAAADTILLPEGQLALSIAGANEDMGATGDFDIRNPVTIVGQGGRGVDASVIDARPLRPDRIFHVHDGVGPVEFRSFSMYGGAAQLQPGVFQSFGGGVYVGAGANVTLRSCTVGASDASHGGGIYTAGAADVTLRDVLIEANTASVRGGGLASVGADIAVIASAVVDNATAGGVAQSGGGFSLSTGKLTVRDSAFTGNVSASSGGAIFAEYAELDIAGSELTGNRARNYGGAIGRYALDDPPMLLVNSTISGNETTDAVDGGGGGVGFVFDGGFPVVATFVNVTFANNTAAKGASQIECLLCAEQNLRMRSSIVASGAAPLCNAPVVTHGGNLATDGSCGFADATDAENVADMKLAALADNGGLTRTMELLLGSPAVGATVAGTPAVVADQRGYGKGGDPDSGAYERIGLGGSTFSCPRDQAAVVSLLEYIVEDLIDAPEVGRLIRCLNELYD